MVRGVLKLVIITRKRTSDYTKKTKESPFPVAWVQTFGPTTREISELVTQVNRTLKLYPCWTDVERPLGVLSRTGKILNRKEFSLELDLKH